MDGGGADPGPAGALMPWLADRVSTRNAMPATDDVVQAWQGVDVETTEAFRYGRPVSPEEVPRRCRLEGRRKTLPEAFRVHGGPKMVSARLRALLEAHDLGPTRVHDVEVVHLRGAPMGPGCGLLHVMAFKDTFVPEASQGRPFEHKDLGSVYHLPQGTEGAVALSPAAREGVDLWHERLECLGVYLSDRLAEAWRRERSRGPKLYECPTAERPGGAA